MRYRKWLKGASLSMLMLSLCACTTLDAGRAPPLEKGARWAVLPAINNTETPMAAARLEAISISLLRAQGVNNLVLYPAPAEADLLKPVDRRAQEAALDWARSQQARYAVLGSVQEWRYKTGLDGEPAVGVTLSVLDVSTGHVIWSGSGARTGWSREAVAAVAQKLIAQLLGKALAHARE